MTGQKPIVAVVDDDPRVLESLEELLESAGYAARSFASAGALLACGVTGVDILITDIGMPGMSGLELRDQLKEARPDLPVLLITGRHEIADYERGQGVGGVFYKPFDGQVLLAAVGDALRLRKGG